MKDCVYIKDANVCGLYGNFCEDRPKCVPLKSIKGQDELIEPKSPIRANFYSDGEYIKARKQYKTDRTRYLNALKHRESGSMLVDHSIDQFKANKKYRTKKDSTWRAEQENAIPQKSIINYIPCRWVNCKKPRFPGQIYCKEHLDYTNTLLLKINKKGEK